MEEQERKKDLAIRHKKAKAGAARGWTPSSCPRRQVQAFWGTTEKIL